MSQCCAAVTQTVVSWASKSDIWSQFSPDYYNRKSLFAALTKKKGGPDENHKVMKVEVEHKSSAFVSLFSLISITQWFNEAKPLKNIRNILFSNQVIPKLIWSNFAVTAVVTSYFWKFLKCWSMSNYTSAHMLTFSANTERSNFEGNIAI